MSLGKAELRLTYLYKSSKLIIEMIFPALPLQSFMRRAAALLFLFLISCIVFLGLTKTAFAQNLNQPQIQTQQNQYVAPDTNPDVPKNLHTWTQSVMIEVMSAAICQLAGIDVTNTSQGCLGVDPKTQKIGFVQNGGGMLGVMKNMIVTLYTPPIHTGDYFNYLAKNFGIAKLSYAASSIGGLGFSSLQPLTGLWVVFRNFVYLIFVMVFLFIGIGIMFRVRIDPRTVMTIQNQIPKIIIGLVLVTFSFAIAGLLIDLMYVLCYVFVNIISSADPKLASNTGLGVQLIGSTNPFEALSVAVTTAGSGPLGALGDLAWNPAQTVGGWVGGFFSNPIGSLIMGFVGGLIGVAIGQAAGTAVGGIATIAGGILGFFATGNPLGASGGAMIGKSVGDFVGSILGVSGAVVGALKPEEMASTIAGLLAFLVIVIAVLTSLFRLWIMLLTSYIGILLDVVFAPIWIMLGLIPNSKVTFNTWLRDLVGNLIAFPTVIVMFLLARVFMDGFGPTQTSGQFVAPLIGNPNFPNSIGSLIALGMVLMAPAMITTLKSALKAPGFGLGKAMQPLGAGVGMLVNTGKRVAGAKVGAEEYRVSEYSGGQVKYAPKGALRSFGERFLR